MKPDYHIDWVKIMNMQEDAKAIGYMDKYREDNPLLLIDFLLRASAEEVKILRYYTSDTLFYKATIAKPTVFKDLSVSDVWNEYPELLNEKVERITIQKGLCCPLFEIELDRVKTTDEEVTRIAKEHGDTPHKCPRLRQDADGYCTIVYDE